MSPDADDDSSAMTSPTTFLRHGLPLGNKGSMTNVPDKSALCGTNVRPESDIALIRYLNKGTKLKVIGRWK
jgi:hypothetical protein